MRWLRNSSNLFNESKLWLDEGDRKKVSAYPRARVCIPLPENQNFVSNMHGVLQYGDGHLKLDAVNQLTADVGIQNRIGLT